MQNICIVGGGPAGLATSIALAQAGFRATVLDCATPPVDKACGEGLLPESLSALDRLGVKLPAGCGHVFQGIRFSDEHSAVSARFPKGHALGVRRTVLHTLLADRATELGVDLQWGRKHTGQITCDLTVGADGGNSGVRRRAGLDGSNQGSHRYGFRQHFQIAPWSDYMEVHWSRRCQLYITPVSSEQIGVAVVSHDPKLRLRDALQDFREVRERIKGAVEVSGERGSLSTMRSLPAVHNGSVVLIGDASGSVDVITGEGIGLSFQQALALAESLRQGGLDFYARAHRAIGRRPRLMARMLLALATYPKLRRPALAGLSLCPQIFSSLLAFHVREAL